MADQSRVHRVVPPDRRETRGEPWGIVRLHEDAASSHDLGQGTDCAREDRRVARECLDRAQAGCIGNDRQHDRPRVGHDRGQPPRLEVRRV